VAADASFADEWKAVQDAERRALAWPEIVKRLKCEGHAKANAKLKLDMNDGVSRDAIQSFQFRHKVYEYPGLRTETMVAFGKRPVQGNFEQFQRVMRERVADAAGILEDGTAQVGPGQVGTSQDGVGQDCTAQVGTSQVGASQIGTGQDCASKVGTSQVGPGQVGTFEVGTAQVGTSQDGIREGGKRQHGTSQVGIVQVGTSEVGTRKQGIGQVGSREVTARQILSRERAAPDFLCHSMFFHVRDVTLVFYSSDITTQLQF
jgi:hypothetical protein